jgi:hypothetical protein
MNFVPTMADLRSGDFADGVAVTQRETQMQMFS